MTHILVHKKDKIFTYNKCSKHQITKKTIYFVAKSRNTFEVLSNFTRISPTSRLSGTLVSTQWTHDSKGFKVSLHVSTKKASPHKPQNNITMCPCLCKNWNLATTLPPPAITATYSFSTTSLICKAQGGHSLTINFVPAYVPPHFHWIN